MAQLRLQSFYQSKEHTNRPWNPHPRCWLVGQGPCWLPFASSLTSAVRFAERSPHTSPQHRTILAFVQHQWQLQPHLHVPVSLCGELCAFHACSSSCVARQPLSMADIPYAATCRRIPSSNHSQRNLRLLRCPQIHQTGCPRHRQKIRRTNNCCH